MQQDVTQIDKHSGIDREHAARNYQMGFDFASDSKGARLIADRLLNSTLDDLKFSHFNV